MDTYLEKLGLRKEVFFWLEKIGRSQAMYVLACVAKLLKFAEQEEAFFQGCGLYVAGSSLTKDDFNDIDIVLVGLDFRAVVSYSKIFLMDPETLVKEGVLVQPQLFLNVGEDKNNGQTTLVPISDVKKTRSSCEH